MDVLATLELAHRLREEAYETSWVSYAERMLRAAADLEKLVYQNQEKIAAPAQSRQ